MQYQPQMQPAPKKERLPPELTIPIISANLELKQISEQKLRMSKSMEFLDKPDGKGASPTKGNGQQTGKKSVGAGKKATDKKEKEVVSCKGFGIRLVLAKNRYQRFMFLF